MSLTARMMNNIPAMVRSFVHVYTCEFVCDIMFDVDNLGTITALRCLAYFLCKKEKVKSTKREDSRQSYTIHSQRSPCKYICLYTVANALCL